MTSVSSLLAAALPYARSTKEEAPAERERHMSASTLLRKTRCRICGKLQILAINKKNEKNLFHISAPLNGAKKKVLWIRFGLEGIWSRKPSLPNRTSDKPAALTAADTNTGATARSNSEFQIRCLRLEIPSQSSNQELIFSL